MAPAHARQLPTLNEDMVQAADQLTTQVSTWELLDPLAPVALSPFFGLACLSGIATFGPDWLQERSALFRDSGPLNNPWLFGMMVVLTALTSLPRLTKVSKPIALLSENLETYSVAIIFVAMRMSPAFSDSSPDLAVIDGSMVMAGIAWTSFPTDLLLAIASALNIIVINMVKLSFEFFVWLIPFPTVDALFELANKSLSATLMGLYCYSPFLASVVNLLVLAVCLVLFDRVWKRVQFCRGILLEPILARLFPTWYPQASDRFRGYLVKSMDGFARCSPVLVTSDGRGWRITSQGWWRKLDLYMEDGSLMTKKNFAVDIVTIRSADGHSIEIFRRK